MKPKQKRATYINPRNKLETALKTELEHAEPPYEIDLNCLHRPIEEVRDDLKAMNIDTSQARAAVRERLSKI